VLRFGAFWSHCVRPFWPKHLVQLALITGLWFAQEGVALATEKPAVSTGPTRLSDRQLDRVTAAGPTLSLDLSASAQGLNAIASTAGTIQSANTTIMQVDLSPGAPARLLSTTQATVIIAAGQATASGTDGAQCSANIQTTGTFSFLRVVSETTNLPPSAPGLPYVVTCACGALAIAPH
jgi:hypothetical protein